MDGNPGTTILYYNCEFWEKSSGSYLGGNTNLHGLIDAPSGSIPSDIIFIDSIGKTVGYSTQSNLVADKLWVSGGSYYSVAATGSLTTLYHFGVTTVAGKGSGGGIVNDVTGMPVIVGGMSPKEKLRYFGTPA